RTYDQIVADMLAKIAARTKLTNFNVGSVIRTLVEILGAAIADLGDLALACLKAGFIATATGYWLDLKAKEFGVTRHPAKATEGVVYFCRTVPKNENIVIPAGTIVSTLKDQEGKAYRFFTKEEVILATGTTEIEAAVVAEQPGAAHNVGPGSIQKTAVHIRGVDRVENRDEWITSEGTDEETDASLRARCFLAWEELTQGSTERAYISWALSDARVTSAFVNSQHPRGQGTVNVYILGAGGMPSQSLIDDVQAVIDENRPLCVDALVLAPDEIEVDLDFAIVPRRWVPTTTIEAEVRKRLQAYFNPQGDPAYPWIEPLGVGKKVVFHQLVEIVMSVDGVYDVRFVSPLADIEVDTDELPTIRTLAIRFEGAVA
ncbi:MAG TPA: baseplate J/gp47 family protein, partial [bacterium]|nr:baseplate J/gp47 family protein [bacterium]